MISKRYITKSFRVKDGQKISFEYIRWQFAQSQLLETLISLTTQEKLKTSSLAPPVSESDTNWNYIARREALLYLTKNGEDYFYSLYKFLCKQKIALAKHQFAQSQVGRALHSLKSEGYIESHDGGLGHKGQKSGPFYYITMLGLLKALTYRLSPEDIRLIAKKNADKIPLIFGEWGYFEDKGAAENIVHALRYYYIQILTSIIEGKDETQKIEPRRKFAYHYYNQPELNASVLTRFILFNCLPLLTLRRLETVEPMARRIFETSRKTSLDWIKIWADNPRLKKYLVDQLAREDRDTEDLLTRIRDLEHHINVNTPSEN